MGFGTTISLIAGIMTIIIGIFQVVFAMLTHSDLKKVKKSLGVTVCIAILFLVGAYVIPLKPINVFGFGPASTPTVTASRFPYPPYKGVLALTNPLGSSTSGWEESHSSSDPGTCRFTAGAYYAIQPQKDHFTTCMYGGNTFMHFTFEVRMTIIQGDCGGIVFDADDVGKHFYYFRICQANGAYVLDIAYKNNSARTIAYGSISNSDFKAGLGQSNTVAVDIQENNFAVYVNNFKLPNINNSSYTSSYGASFIGVLADNGSFQTIVAFNDAKVWTF